MNFSKKKLVITLSSVIVAATAVTLGIRSLASNGKTVKDEYSTGLEVMNEEEKTWLLKNAVNIENVQDYYDYVDDGVIGCTYDDADVAQKNEAKQAVKDTVKQNTAKVNESTKADEAAKTNEGNKSSQTKSEVALGSNDMVKSEYVFPSKIDNSQSKYFPKIDSQGAVGSCCAWAMVYYQMSYMYNKAMDRSSKDMDNVFSPTWTHEMVGGNESAIGKMLMQMGAAPVSDVPIITYYDGGVDTKFRYFAEKGVWRDALNYRLESVYLLEDPIGCDIVGPKSKALDEIKAALSNGELLTFTTEVYRWHTQSIKYEEGDSLYNDTDNAKYEGESIVSRCDNNNGGLHRMTLVGYDDSIWYDINENGIKEEGELGAFKVANSWGQGYCNDGFVWLSYDALNSASSVKENSEVELGDRRIRALSDIMGYRVRTTKTSQFAEFTLNTASSSGVDVDIQAVEGDKTHYYDVYQLDGFGAGLSFDGQENQATDGVFTIALDNVVPDVNSEKIKNMEWTVKLADVLADDIPTVVKNVKIIDEDTGITYEQNNTDKIELDGCYKKASFATHTSASNTTTIYYNGYAKPYIHYCTEGSEWTKAPGIAMQKTNEKAGFTHKAVINLKNASSVQVCFNDGAGNWDSKNGANYSFAAGIYTYTNGNITKISDNKIEFDADLIVKTYDAVNVLDDVKLSVKTVGTQENLLYRFGYITDDNKKAEHMLTEYTLKSDCVWNPDKAGQYTLFVDVKDGLGKVIRRYYHKYVVEPISIKDLKCSLASPQRAGCDITLMARTSNEVIRNDKKSVYRYDIVNANGAVKTLKTLGDNSAIWSPTVKGKYKIKVTVTDGANQSATYEINYEIKDQDPSLKIEDIVMNNGDEVIKGTYGSAYVQVDGGMQPYSIDFGYYDTDGKEVCITKNNAYGYVNLPTPYVGLTKYYAVVTDATGKSVRYEKSIDVKGCIITDVEANPTAPHVGEETVFNINTKYEINYRGVNSRTMVITNDETKEQETISTGGYGSSELRWTPKAAGMYTIDITLYTYGSGTVYKTIKFKVLDKLDDSFYISEIKPSIKSPAKLGDSIYFDLNTVNETQNEANKRVINIVNNATKESTTITDYPYAGKNRAIWTPKTVGKYTISIVATSINETAQASMEYEVGNQDPEDSVTIYYKGFSTPYLHYRVDNGNWNNSPGLAMTPTNELTGYTHKVTIALKNESEAIVCFNDGNDNWDSNNGRNYYFTKGRYAYSEGTIKTLDENNRFVVENNIATIYYKGYANPYCHYSLDGKWTVAPGVAMTPTNELAGYTHKIDIDLLESKSVTACFNDGNNNWDSNNGQNYVFAAGINKYSK